MSHAAAAAVAVLICNATSLILSHNIVVHQTHADNFVNS